MSNYIEMNSVNMSYGKKQVLFDVSISVPRGCIFGLLGPSGCGKTTSVKIMAGILSADSGEALVMNEKMPSLATMGKIGYMAQSDALYETLSAYENLKFFGKIYGLKKPELDEKISYVMKLVDLTDDLHKPISAYSGGMKRRLSLAIALLAEPQVLLLDEPTVGIDPVLRDVVWTELHKLAETGISILVTTHVMDEAAKCDTLAMMRSGRLLIADKPEEICRRAGTDDIEDAFIFFGKSGGDYDEN